MDWINVGKRIKEARKKKRIYQREIAKRIGVSISMISKYENKGGKIPFDNLKTICEVLELDIAKL